MKRRTVLRVGAATALVLGLAGAGVAWHRPALTSDGRLTSSGRQLFTSIAAAVLDGLLPDAPSARRAALDAYLQRLEATIAGFPPAVRAEIVELAALLAHPAGRFALAGLSVDWADAEIADVQAMLQSLRESRLGLRQQIYHALRDLTNGAYFADSATWAAIGYPGPADVRGAAPEAERT